MRSNQEKKLVSAKLVDASGSDDDENDSSGARGSGRQMVDEIPLHASNQFTFPEKLHIMLEKAEDASGKKFNEIVSWMPDNSAFRVHDRDKFVKTVMPQFFHMTKFKSFLRQLNIWSFVLDRAADSPNRGGYSHELFVRSHKELCRQMKRTKTRGLYKRKKQNHMDAPQASSPRVREDSSNLPDRPNAAFRTSQHDVHIASQPDLHLGSMIPPSSIARQQPALGAVSQGLEEGFINAKVDANGIYGGSPLIPRNMVASAFPAKPDSDGSGTRQNLANNMSQAFSQGISEHDMRYIVAGMQMGAAENDDEAAKASKKPN